MLYAIDIPPSVDVNVIYELLNDSEKHALLTFEEGYFPGHLSVDDSKS